MAAAFAAPLLAVFSRPAYALAGCATFVIMLIPLLHASGHLFFEPYLVGHIPYGTEASFALIVSIAALAGAVIPMNVYRVMVAGAAKKKVTGGVAGSAAGAAAGACSCGPVGFSIISAFGIAGASVTAAISEYELPIRLGALGLLAASYYTTSKALSAECVLRQSR